MEDLNYMQSVDLRGKIASGKAAGAGHTLCMFKPENAAWHNFNRKNQLISRRRVGGVTGSFLGMVSFRTPSAYSALMASVSMPRTLKLRV